MQDHLTTVAPCAGQGELAEFHLPWNGIDAPLTGGSIQPNATVSQQQPRVSMQPKKRLHNSLKLLQLTKQIDMVYFTVSEIKFHCFHWFHKMSFLGSYTRWLASQLQFLCGSSFNQSIREALGDILNRIDLRQSFMINKGQNLVNRGALHLDSDPGNRVN